MSNITQLNNENILDEERYLIKTFLHHFTCYTQDDYPVEEFCKDNDIFRVTNFIIFDEIKNNNLSLNKEDMNSLDISFSMERVHKNNNSANKYNIYLNVNDNNIVKLIDVTQNEILNGKMATDFIFGNNGFIRNLATYVSDNGINPLSNKEFSELLNVQNTEHGLRGGCKIKEGLIRTLGLYNKTDMMKPNNDKENENEIQSSKSGIKPKLK